jgi:hypothetical protein
MDRFFFLSISFLFASAAAGPAWAGGKPSHNTVVVSPRGGDFTNPVDAMKNAFRGRHWCDLPNGVGCVMLIEPGTYAMSETLHVVVRVIGAGRERVTLNAKAGVQVAVVLDRSTISGVTINNSQSSATRAVAVQVQENDLKDVTANARGATENIGCLGTAYHLENVACTATGGQRATGVDAEVLFARRSSFVASAAAEISFGAHVGGMGGESTFIDCAASGDYAVNSSGDPAGLAIHGGTFVGGKVGISAAGFNSSSSVIHANISGGEIGLSFTPDEGSKADLVLDDSRVNGPTAVRLGSPGPPGTGVKATIVKSILVGTVNVIKTQSPMPVDIDESALQGGNLLALADGTPVRIGLSKLMGTFAPGNAIVKCAGVYDGNYDFFAKMCP